MDRAQYVKELRKKEQDLKRKTLDKLNNHTGDIDSFFECLKHCWYEYDCVRAAIKQNS